MLQPSRRTGLLGAVVLVLLCAACAQPPMGPTVQVLPGQGKSFDAFQRDQFQCRQYAEQSVAGQAQNANNRAVAGGLITTALGAGLGAAIGAAGGNAGAGAAIGAGAGALGGGAFGAASSSNAQLSIQDQYNNAFAQCMYAHGNMVPGYGPMISR
jgi:outer membrane lipoprotein SlyB